MNVPFASRGVLRAAGLTALTIAACLLVRPAFPRQPSAPPAPAKAVPSPSAAPALPRMVDLGKRWCIPCKQMVAVLQEAELRYKGKAAIEFIDLDEHPEAAGQYKIMMIPTQIFFTADGKEFERHVGYLPFEEVEKIFTKMGVQRAGAEEKR